MIQASYSDFGWTAVMKGWTAALDGLSGSAQIQQAQEILISRWGMSATVGRADGILGPKTYNALSQVLGPSWNALSGAEILNRLNTRTTTTLPSYPYPDRVRLAQQILGVTVDGKLGPGTAAALDVALKDWKGRPWAAHMIGNVPDSLTAKTSFPMVPAPGTDEPSGGVSPVMINPAEVSAGMNALRDRLQKDSAPPTGASVNIPGKAPSTPSGESKPSREAPAVKAGAMSTPMMIGIGAAAVLAIGGAVLMAKRGKRRRRR